MMMIYMDDSKHQVSNALIRMYDARMKRSGDIAFPKANPIEINNRSRRVVESVDASLTKHRRVFQSERDGPWHQLYDMLTFQPKFETEVYSATAHHVQISVPIRNLPKVKLEKK
eukprot:TRINITY_DN100819_c0_g1_i1.p1 TRINITY_DN100819_c0_g1~~TRINITY_DN100819_c0_g1_i1.p1  ORF type:complete len:114 (-),score=5.95 TRINITY_DN100819_c0_g1_i1:96-437(-)